MKLSEFREQLQEVSFDHMPDGDVFVLDAEGFRHLICFPTWDADDNCFYVNTKFFTPEAEQNDV